MTWCLGHVPQGLHGGLAHPVLELGHDRVRDRSKGLALHATRHRDAQGFEQGRHDVNGLCAFLTRETDRNTKRGGIGTLIALSGDRARDRDRIRAYYASVIAAPPEGMGPVRLRDELPKPGP